MSSTILHLDCDCFFAAVEMREQPQFREVPIAVGGETDRRGVITTCNYPARRFGIKSAMPTAMARQLCADLVILPSRMALYRQVSQQVMAILRGYSKQLEIVSVDEAYFTLDDHLDSEAVAETIRIHIEQQLGISVSIGIADCKFLAKIASDWNKPNGQFRIRPDHKDEFMLRLPVAAIPGVGPAFQQRLSAIGITNCADAQSFELKDLVSRFGRSGAMLYQRCRGIDPRGLVSVRQRKSVSTERTYSRNLMTADACLDELPELYRQWCLRLEKTSWSHREMLPFIKVKFSDFSQTTMADQTEQASLEGFQRLLQRALKDRQISVRLLGIGGRFPEIDSRQLALF